MLTKQHIESILRANGVPPTAPEEEIRSVLISARFDNFDVDTALLILKENKETNETHVDTLHKVFHSDERLSASDISSLLGIHVAIPRDDITNITEIHTKVTHHDQFLIVTASLLLAIGAVLGYMYWSGTGLFFQYVAT